MLHCRFYAELMYRLKNYVILVYRSIPILILTTYYPTKHYYYIIKIKEIETENKQEKISKEEVRKHTCVYSICIKTCLLIIY